jgi:hypothetical protein
MTKKVQRIIITALMALGLSAAIGCEDPDPNNLCPNGATATFCPD